MKFIFVLLFVAVLANGTFARNPNQKGYNLKKEFLKADKTLKDLKKTEKELREQLEKIKKYEAEAKAAKNFYEAQARKHNGVKQMKNADKNSANNTLIASGKKVKNGFQKSNATISLVKPVVQAAAIAASIAILPASVQPANVVDVPIVFPIAAPPAPVEEVAPIVVAVDAPIVAIISPVEESVLAPAINIPVANIDSYIAAPLAPIEEVSPVIRDALNVADVVHVKQASEIIDTPTILVVPEAAVQEISVIATIKPVEEAVLAPAVKTPVEEVANIDSPIAAPSVPVEEVSPVPSVDVVVDAPNIAIISPVEEAVPVITDAPIVVDVTLVKESVSVALSVVPEAAVQEVPLEKDVVVEALPVTPTDVEEAVVALAVEDIAPIAANTVEEGTIVAQ
ncbi:unnamed protein product [Diamesa serratosioi]